MSKKISSFFKVIPKSDKASNTSQRDAETPTKVKTEFKAGFEIDNQISSKFESKSLNEFKIRDCKVILQDIIKSDSKCSFEVNKSGTKTFGIENIGSSSISNSECSKKAANSPQIRQSSSIKSTTKNPPKPVQDLPICCHFCDLKFTKIRSLNQHIGFKHPNLKQKFFECDFDGKFFESRAKLQSHIDLHKSKVKCQFCHKLYLPRVLKPHIQNSHTTETKFQCNLCSKCFKTKKILSKHVKSHDKKFECKICSKKFRDQFDLTTHIKNYHENPRSFGCEICDKKFNTKRELQLHQKNRDKNRPKPYKCQRCNYAADILSKLKYHQKSHEKQDKKFSAMANPKKCEKCYKFFINKGRLSWHMKLVHPKELFQCDLCGKYLKSKLSLSEHITERICQKV